MNVHEYQAKKFLQDQGIQVPRGFLARTPTEAEFGFRRLKAPVSVLKAQVHAGGRGKAGGVKVVKSPEECFKAASQMLGMRLVTKQTGTEGKLVTQVYVEEGSQIQKEYYLALLVDRETASIRVVFSKEGGMDIEEVAETHPEHILSIAIDPTLGLQPYHLRRLTFEGGLNEAESPLLADMVEKLFRMFCRYDCSMIEINPLVITASGAMIPLDAKLSFDDNALYRHPDIEALRDFQEEDAREIEASKYSLNYIGLEGNIGCLVNGAGLAMATMDIIKHHGGQPANFLDVGGGASEEQVRHAFRIILQDKSVQGIFVNIFGGIMRCDIIANGIIAATKDLGLTIPLVVRLEGTNVELGQQILNHSGLKVLVASNMADGAQKIVKAVS